MCALLSLLLNAVLDHLFVCLSLPLFLLFRGASSIVFFDLLRYLSERCKEVVLTQAGVQTFFDTLQLFGCRAAINQIIGPLLSLRQIFPWLISTSLCIDCGWLAAGPESMLLLLETFRSLSI